MSCELFVGNLNPVVRMRDLENCFGRYGKILRCDLKKNFGFIQFEDRRDAEEAVRKENDRTLLGSRMTVEWAKGSVGDKSGRGGPNGFRKPHSPPRFNNRPGRDRSPFGGGRARSPVGRGGRDRSPVGRNSNSSFSQRDSGPRDDRFGGGQRRMSGGRGSFDSRSNFDSRSRDRFTPRERYDGGDRFQSDRSRGQPVDRNRGAPRENGYSDRHRGGDRRDSFGERRSFGSGPRRF